MTPERSPIARLLGSDAPGPVVLVRLVVGAVFLSEGIQKFLFPAGFGAGRFIKIGIPAPDVMAPFVGIFEILCGTLVLAELLTRLAAIPLIVDMVIAISTRRVVIGRG